MEEYKILTESMEVIMAQEQLMKFEASMISDMKDNSRSKTVAKYEKSVNKFKEKKIMTTDELFKMLGK